MMGFITENQMGKDNPHWIDLSLAKVLIFKNEATATTGMQDYSISSNLILKFK